MSETRTHRRCTLSAVIAAAIAGGAAGSTDPVRNSAEREATVNPPQTTNPIYFPLCTDSPAKVVSEQATAEELLREFMRRHSAMDYPAAAEAAMRLVHAAPDAPEAHYNLACAMCRLQRHDEAIAALNKAVECGWRDLRHTVMDPDLTGVRGSVAFSQVVESIKTRIAAERLTPVQLRNDPWPQVVQDIMTVAPQAMRAHRVPAMSIALVHQGEVVWTQAFGVSDTQSAQPLAMDDRFRVIAPAHFLALVAAHQQEERGGMPLAQLLQDAAELNWYIARRQHGQPPRLAARSNRASDARFIPVGMNRTTDPNETSTSERRVACTNSFELLRISVELESQQSFAEYCSEFIFMPLGMSQSNVGARPEQATVPGHTRLGSVIANEEIHPQAADFVLYTTARDLAKLIAAALDETGGASGRSAAAVGEAVLTARAIDRRNLGLAVEARRAQGGLRMQVSGLPDGVGCLMRWYEANRSGVVILYNSASGQPAAELIAHRALGGD